MAELNRPTARLLAEAGNMVKVCAMSNLSGDCIWSFHGTVVQSSKAAGGSPRRLCLLGAIRGVSGLQLFREKYRCGSPAFVPIVLK
jgi:hypothetical protein